MGGEDECGAAIIEEGKLEDEETVGCPCVAV
jgi:hypothetical protein